MTTIHWFRKGLRLHDNPALLAAVKESTELRPVFVLDPWFVKNQKVGPNRWRFLAQSLADLDAGLRKLKSRLFVVRGSPEEVFPRLFKEWDVKTITWELDTEPYSRTRDEKVERLAKECGVEVVCKVGHTLYRIEKIIDANLGKTPLTYQALQKLVSKLGHPPNPLDTLTELPDTSQLQGNLATDASFDPPTLKELGVEEEELEPCLYPGGETEALARLEKYMERKSWVCKFEKPKTSPNSLQPSTTVLSPYLKFGCLSPRTMYHQLIQIYKGSTHSQPPVSLLGQLLWREFFYTVGATTPNFDRMEGNPVCRQIPWVRDEKLMDAWTNAKTGYPFIDAIMIQLRKEGWIHHLARHAVACFLTRGDLWQPWEDGMKVFEELLLDADWSLNAGNWMWLSASAFFNSYFRVYSPIAFGKNTDKHGDYIRKYLPQLAKYPDSFIYEPWKAPLGVQRAAGCIIGQDYPRPIVDHAVAMKRNLERMGQAYRAGGRTKNKATNGPLTKAITTAAKQHTKAAVVCEVNGVSRVAGTQEEEEEEEEAKDKLINAKCHTKKKNGTVNGVITNTAVNGKAETAENVLVLDGERLCSLFSGQQSATQTQHSPVGLPLAAMPQPLPAPPLPGLSHAGPAGCYHTNRANPRGGQQPGAHIVGLPRSASPQQGYSHTSWQQTNRNELRVASQNLEVQRKILTELKNLNTNVEGMRGSLEGMKDLMKESNSMLQLIANSLSKIADSK